MQSDLIFCDLLQRQNSVAETKIFTKILQHARSDLSLRLKKIRSNLYCRLTCTHGVIRRRDVLLQLVCTGLYGALSKSSSAGVLYNKSS